MRRIETPVAHSRAIRLRARKSFLKPSARLLLVGRDRKRMGADGLYSGDPLVQDAKSGCRKKQRGTQDTPLRHTPPPSSPRTSAIKGSRQWPPMPLRCRHRRTRYAFVSAARRIAPRAAKRSRSSKRRLELCRFAAPSKFVKLHAEGQAGLQSVSIHPV